MCPKTIFHTTGRTTHTRTRDRQVSGSGGRAGDRLPHVLDELGRTWTSKEESFGERGLKGVGTVRKQNKPKCGQHGTLSDFPSFIQRQVGRLLASSRFCVITPLHAWRVVPSEALHG